MVFLLQVFTFSQLSQHVAHRLSPLEFQGMRIVHEAVQDRVSECVFTDTVVPLIGGQLADDDR